MPEPDWSQYIRWRPRMVRQSVFDDLVEALVNAGWYDEVDPSVIPNATRGLLEGHPVVLREAFPEEAEYREQKILPNTLAMDQGVPGEEYPWEMGTGMTGQDYTFTFAFYAVSDACATALFQDLADRYWGRTGIPVVTLYNYVGAEPTPVLNMDVDEFRFNRSVEQIYPGHELYFAELVVTDFLSQKMVEMD